MTTSVNLMSEKSQVRESYRTCLRQWSKLLLLAAVAIVIHGLVTWWPVRNHSQQLETLEAQYEPIRQFKAQISKLNRKIAATQAGYELELALSEQTPMVPLVGVLNRVVAEGRGNVFFKHFDYVQQGPLDDQPTETVLLEGYGTDSRSVAALAHRLRQAMPFAEIELRNTETIEVNSRPVESFRIECTL